MAHLALTGVVVKLAAVVELETLARLDLVACAVMEAAEVAIEVEMARVVANRVSSVAGGHQSLPSAKAQATQRSLR